MRMHVPAIAFLIIALQAESSFAQTNWLWCEPSRAYFPYVQTCPVPWRAVAQPQQPAAPQPLYGQPTPLLPQTTPSTIAPVRAGADIEDELSNWCNEQEKASSVVICADRDLRQLSMIRNKLFADAKALLSPEAFQQLLADQRQWIQTYSSSCGIPGDGPKPSLPISAAVIGCYRREALGRITDLIYLLGKQKPGYRPSSINSTQTALVDEALARRAEQERAEQERQRTVTAEQERRERQRREREEELERETAQKELRRQAIESVRQKLRDAGYIIEEPLEFELDWRALRTKSQKVAIRGTYMERDDVEGLVVSNKDMPFIVITHPGTMDDGRGGGAPRTARMSARADLRLAVAVLTTDRKAA